MKGKGDNGRRDQETIHVPEGDEARLTNASEELEVALGGAPSPAPPLPRDCGDSLRGGSPDPTSRSKSVAPSEAQRERRSSRRAEAAAEKPRAVRKAITSSTRGASMDDGTRSRGSIQAACYLRSEEEVEEEGGPGGWTSDQSRTAGPSLSGGIATVVDIPCSSCCSVGGSNPPSVSQVWKGS